jgi:hypothetical protein
MPSTLIDASIVALAPQRNVAGRLLHLYLDPVAR